MADFNTVLERFLPIANSNATFFIESTLDFLDLGGLICSSRTYHQQATDIVAWYKCLLLKCKDANSRFTRMNDIASVILAAPFLSHRKDFLKDQQTADAGFDYIKKHGAALRQAAEECNVTWTTESDETANSLPLFTRVLYNSLGTQRFVITPDQLEEVLSHKCGYATLIMCSIPPTMPPDYLQTIANGGNTNVLVGLHMKPEYTFDMTAVGNTNPAHLMSWIMKAPEDQVMRVGSFYAQDPVRFDRFAKMLFDVWRAATSVQICKDKVLKMMEVCRRIVVSGGFTGTHVLLPVLIEHGDLVFLNAYLDCFCELPYTMVLESKYRWKHVTTIGMAGDSALCMVYGKFANRDMQSAKFVFLQLMDAFDCANALEIINMIIAQSKEPMVWLVQFVQDMRKMLSEVKC